MDTAQNKTEATAPASGNTNQNTAMAILAYIGPLVIVSYLVAKDDPFVKFHIKQGLVLFVVEVVVRILSSMFGPLWMLFNLVNLAVFVLAVFGIVNVSRGYQKKLPVVGDFSRYFTF